MKQLFQSLSTGVIEVLDSPSPSVLPGHVLIQTQFSLISSGTERMLIEFGTSNLFNKAAQQPDKVKMIINKVKTDGLLSTVESVSSKLSNPIALGYCNSGIVVAVGEGVSDIRVGDRVASNGSHAEIVRIPENLCAKIPETVSMHDAAFVVPSAIGLQGIRLAMPTLGECFVVFGAGLIGLLTIQLLIAHGCRVLAIDFDKEKLKLAQSFGAEIFALEKNKDPVPTALAFSRGRGVDGVIITASTKSNAVVSQSAQMSRQRGRIVLVGVVGLNLQRDEFYKKELSFQVSCSYGPGRYDPSFEDENQDYPIGFVRWTETRNFEAVLDMMANGTLNLTPLISNKFLFSDYAKAYKELTNSKTPIGLLLEYNSKKFDTHEKSISLKKFTKSSSGTPNFAFLGAGNYASRILVPAFKKNNIVLNTLVSSGGSSAAIHGKKLGFNFVTSNVQNVLEDPKINSVVVATRHDTHAELAIKALTHGKHVYVEKPLAITIDQLNKLKDVIRTNKHILMVGFNRRFAPLIIEMKRMLDIVDAPKSFILTMNAGSIPASHWTQNLQLGGGRLIGEACHHIDLMRFLSNSKITSVYAKRMTNNLSRDSLEDVVAITLGFKNGSIGTINYYSNGAQNFPKERIEVFTDGKIMQLDNFRKLYGFGWPNFKTKRSFVQDKGQVNCVQAFIKATIGEAQPPIPIDEIFEVADATLDAALMIRENN